MSSALKQRASLRKGAGSRQPVQMSRSVLRQKWTIWLSSGKHIDWRSARGWEKRVLICDCVRGNTHWKYNEKFQHFYRYTWCYDKFARQRVYKRIWILIISLDTKLTLPNTAVRLVHLVLIFSEISCSYFTRIHNPVERLVNSFGPSVLCMEHLQIARRIFLTFNTNDFYDKLSNYFNFNLDRNMFIEDFFWKTYISFDSNLTDYLSERTVIRMKAAGNNKAHLLYPTHIRR
jgi:hypothetical protein